MDEFLSSNALNPASIGPTLPLVQRVLLALLEVLD
ncbi:exosporium leader peptide-containing protein [Bacillus cereus group sp. Bce033]